MSYDAELRRATPLAARLASRIRATGPISIADYMSECLWDDTDGYYATRSGIGLHGDFITSAEISQVFGELIGIWTAVVWQQVLGATPTLTLAEYGPGRGTLMRDMLRAVRVVPGFSSAVSLHLVEMSVPLATAQRDLLSDAGVPVTWGQNLIGFATPAVVIANEFLDCWPAEQWIKTPDGWRRRGVGCDERGRLQFTVMRDATVSDHPERRLPDAADGAIVESQGSERLAAAFRSLARAGPVVGLILDYGYASSSAGDTLQAVRNHAYEHPLTSPGEADLTTHVNFFELAIGLHEAGLQIDGPLTQSEFLGKLGIVERTTRLMAANPGRAAEIEAGVARLMAPGGMGSLFKVIGLRSAGLSPLPGFR